MYNNEATEDFFIITWPLECVKNLGSNGYSRRLNERKKREKALENVFPTSHSSLCANFASCFPFFSRSLFFLFHGYPHFGHVVATAMAAFFPPEAEAKEKEGSNID